MPRFVYDPWELPPEQRQATFVGREKILDRLLAAVREQQGRGTVQHYILTGPRGIGKTTLLLTLRDRIRQDLEISAKWFCVQLREEEYYIHKQRDLWQLVLQALAVEEKLDEARKIVDLAQETPDEEKSSALLLDGLRSICDSQGKRLLLLIDNFDHIFPSTAAGEGKHRKPDSEYRAFRKRLSTEAFLMTIATSVKLIEDLYAYDKGFFHFFSPVELPELSQDEVAEVLRRLGRADDNTEFLSRLERSTVNLQTLWILTGGNPRLITMLYHILSQREIGEPVQALWETVAGLTPMLRQELAEMPRQQSKTLDALLRLNGAAAPVEISDASRLPLNVVTAQLGRLKDARYVTLEGGGKGKKATYRVADQMFRVWYLMRYVPVARRRIELFIDFLRAWFSLEERKRLFQERWERFQTNQARGFVGLAGRSLRDAEYYAASLDDPRERLRGMVRVADAYVTVGDLPSAAGLFAELTGTKVRSTRKFESLGYSVLACRLAAKADLDRAIKSCSEALAKDPHNAEARALSGECLAKSGRHAEAKEQFDKALEGPRLSAAVRSLALFNRGVAKSHLGDPLGALADYTAAVETPGAPDEVVVEVFFERGQLELELGDLQGAVADCTKVVEMKRAPVEAVARALVRRGAIKGELRDHRGEVADYTAVVELRGAPAECLAMALVNRGSTKGQLGDYQGAIADSTAVTELDGAPTEQVCMALLNRGAAKAHLGDTEAAIADFTATIELDGAPPDHVRMALYNRGFTKGELGDFKGAIADWTAVLERKGAPAGEVATALVMRAAAKSELGEKQGAMADFSAVLELEGAPADRVAIALLNRGLTKCKLSDPLGAIADFTGVIGLKGASAGEVVKALLNRGVAKAELGDLEGAIADYTAVVDLEVVPVGHASHALLQRRLTKCEVADLKGEGGLAAALSLRGFAYGTLGERDRALSDLSKSLAIPGLKGAVRSATTLRRGVAYEQVGKPEQALADYASCAQGGDVLSVHDGLTHTVRLLLSQKRHEEALAWVRRFHELEPSETSLDTRLEARLDTIRAASSVAPLEDMTRVVDALLEADPEELRTRMGFLKPGLELARTNDESVLARLPEEERKMAREIARSLGEAAPQPTGSPPPPVN